jgi:hypothetical protein
MALVALESSLAPSSPRSDIAPLVTVSKFYHERSLKAEDLA